MRRVFRLQTLIYLLLFTSMIVLNSCQTSSPSVKPKPALPDLDPNESIYLDPEAAYDMANLQEVVVLYDDQFVADFSTQSRSLRPPQAYAETLKRGNRLSTQAYNEVNGALINAQSIANLVGGSFGFKASIAPVSDYQAGDAFKVARVIYMGSTYDHPIPQALIDDTAAGAPVTWISYNIWKMGAANLASLGLEYVELIAAYSVEAAEMSYNKIEYRGYDFPKAIVGMDIIHMNPLDPSVKVLAEAKKPTGERIPYALQSGNFWYIADLPTIYISELDRYMVFADLLPQMLGLNRTCSPRAVLRVEDVKAYDGADELARVFGMLEDLSVPYGIATVPYYLEELNNISLTFRDSPAVLAELLKAQASQGEIFQHGTYHMYQGLANPVSVSGDDWEFWNINTNTPIDGFKDWEALKRIRDGQTELRNLGLDPIGWITPHYAAPIDFYPQFKRAYWRQFERRLLAIDDLVGGQLFPYPVRDYPDRTFLIPENTNYLSNVNPLSNFIERAKANSVLDCPWLGMFIHPYLFDPAYTGEGATSVAEFSKFIGELRSLGYRFVAPSKVYINPVNGTTLAAQKVPFVSNAVVQSSKLCMDADSSPVFQYDCSTDPNQLFSFRLLAGTSSVYTIKDNASGECLSVEGSSLDDMVPIVRETCTDAPNQQFRLRNVDTETYQIVSVNSNKCLDIEERADFGGARLEQRGCNKTLPTQQWQFEGKYNN
ncbi:MAG: DUF2334 domain-containing protein [Trueperaceae bacterium]|nr:DUF2334 domain-containing protein [Trueperaceae bacterium]